MITLPTLPTLLTLPKLSTLSGKKTFIVGVLMVVYGLSGIIYSVSQGDMPIQESVNILLEGFAIISLRLGIKKLVPKTD